MDINLLIAVLSIMASIAVFHPSIMAMGGGEAVCMNILAALENDHEVTLISVDEPDFDQLNQYFNTEVRSVSVDRVFPTGHILSKVADMLNLAKTKYWKIRSGILKRYWNPSEYDLIVSSSNEYGFHSPALQYIHYPSGDVNCRQITLWPYYYLYKRISELDENKVHNTRLLTNSAWTASIISNTYNKYPKVVYPPVDTDTFISSAQPWEERENGFVCIGRIKPKKNILQNINIVTELQERGFDTHLHIVGPISDNKYGNSVRKAAMKQDGIFLEGRVDRNTLVDLIGNHKYGLHGKENEHFGMAVAELVAGGTLPIVHNSGGQREIVNQKNELLYNSHTQAVDKIAHILNKEDKGHDLLKYLPDIEDKFGRKRFKQTIRQEVEHMLN